MIGLLVTIVTLLVGAVVKGEYGWWGKRLADWLVRVSGAVVPDTERDARRAEFAAELQHLRDRDGVPGVMWAAGLIRAGLKLRARDPRVRAFFAPRARRFILVLLLVTWLLIIVSVVNAFIFRRDATNRLFVMGVVLLGILTTTFVARRTVRHWRFVMSHGGFDSDEPGCRYPIGRCTCPRE